MPATQTPLNQHPDSDKSPEVSNRVITIPNILCFMRIAGSFALVALAVINEPLWFIGFFLFLSATDWVDGKLAILLNQRSVLGARLDSAADVFLYAALLAGSILLKWDVLIHYYAWFAIAIGSYAASVAASAWKFRRVPSYHTRAAKSCWLLITIGAVCLLGDIAVWPLLTALVAVTLTNVEAILITAVLHEVRADVSSFAQARRIRRSRPN